jgi:glycosyltransferase involved in cell wall biosynthesis
MRHVLAATPGALLALLTLRRLAFLGAALAPPRAQALTRELPTVALAVPARNEEAALDRLLRSIKALDYPAALLEVVFVDDASEDSTAPMLRRFAARRPRTLMLQLPQRSGKAGALNAAMSASGRSAIFVALDADTVPRPDALRRLVEAFADPSVGSAAALVLPANADAGLVARYAATELLIHQVITSAAKDRLDLNPPCFAMTAFRREALEQIGGFSPHGTADDVTAAAELTRAGWRTRFVREAVAETWVVEGVPEYWRQHLRWGRNVFMAASRGRRAAPAPPRRGAELVVSALGYVDRIALAAALASGERRNRQLAAVYLTLRAAEAAVALDQLGRSRDLPRHLAALALLFPLDVAASLAAVLTLPADRRATWTSPARRTSDEEWPSGEVAPITA